MIVTMLAIICHMSGYFPDPTLNYPSLYQSKFTRVSLSFLQLEMHLEVTLPVKAAKSTKSEESIARNSLFSFKRNGTTQDWCISAQANRKNCHDLRHPQFLYLVHRA
jgi:hypothetical protein